MHFTGGKSTEEKVVDALFSRLGTGKLGGQLDPSQGRVLVAVVDGRVGQEAELLPCLDDLAEAAETHGTTDQVLDLGNVVKLAEGRRVAVGVADQVVRGRKVVGLGRRP